MIRSLFRQVSIGAFLLTGGLVVFALTYLLDADQAAAKPAKPTSLSTSQTEILTPLQTSVSAADSFTVSLPIVSYIPAPCSQAPSLISPTNGSLLSGLVPTLIFMPGSYPISYTVATLSKDPSFVNIATEYYSSGFFNIRELRLFDNFEPATTYYWRARDFCGAISSTYSSVVSFTTGSNGVILPAPTLATPVSGTTGIGNQVVVGWNPVGGATEYQIRINEVGQGGSTLYLSPVTTQTLYSLRPNKSYEWSVIAYNDYAYGVTSTKWRFTTSSSESVAVDRDLNPAQFDAVLDWEGNKALTYKIK